MSVRVIRLTSHHFLGKNVYGGAVRVPNKIATFTHRYTRAATNGSDQWQTEPQRARRNGAVANLALVSQFPAHQTLNIFFIQLKRLKRGLVALYSFYLAVALEARFGRIHFALFYDWTKLTINNCFFLSIMMAYSVQFIKNNRETFRQRLDVKNKGRPCPDIQLTQECSSKTRKIKRFFNKDQYKNVLWFN